ncbi:T9SS type B sorting domain-containing protein [Flavobacterium akiainvivens]|nr:T9SS type B sorting domain-containing protein [Flavobacterium akiainvivens]
MKKITTLLLLMLTCAVNAQLSNFTLSLSKTDETCLGNGTITFNVGNTTQNGQILYKVFSLPDTTNAIAVITENYIGGLSAGTYKVQAIQSLGSQMATKESTITINNAIVPFNFSIASSNQYCQSGGTLTINATSGVFASCEIISGPETRPLQASNIFNDLPGGTYNVRVFNNCGVGKVKTFTLSIANATLNISDPSYPDITSPLCDSITVSNVITPSAGPINYPLTVQHVLNLMDINGDEIVINQVFQTGNPDSQVVSVVLPRYLTQTYTYDINVSDNCNTVYQKLANEVNPDITLSLSQLNAPCAEKYLKLTVAKYTDSYTVEFLEAPEGFNPADFNTTPAGPFTESSVIYGSTTNPVPFGNYVVKVTDSCGRTTTEALLIEFKLPTPATSAWNNGCFSLFGGLTINVPPQKIVQATITAAPPAYTGTLPAVVNGNINAQGTLGLSNMPIGSYTIAFTDNCGFEYQTTVVVPPFVEKDFDITTLPSCEAGFGGVKYVSGNGVLTDVFITGAPASFGQALPYDVSANLVDGKFYLNGLPEGTYKVTATDVCGIVKEKEINVVGYTAPTNPYIYTASCGTFSVKVTDTSNGTEAASYWLQKYFPDTNTWGHPGTGVAYTFDDVPTEANSVRLYNNTAKNNLSYQGKFRIIKKFETFTTASAQNTMCVSILGEFNYNDVLKINTAYTLACLGSPNDVMLDVTGQPVSYKIVEKNGDEYAFDNGNNNVFTNLEPAEYVFRIEDACGNVVQQWFNVSSMPSIADATQPADLVLCAEPGMATPTGEFHLTDQTDDVLGPLHSAMYTVTYHTSYEDADNGVNALPEYYTNVTNGQIIYVRLIHNEISLCHGITSFHLYIGEYQEPVILSTGTICNDGELTLTVSRSFDSYLWSTGETTRSIKVSEAGNYTLMVEKNYGSATCDGFAEFEIIKSATPEIKEIETHDWTEDNNTITVHTKEEGVYEYSLDGVTYQPENTFTGLGTGKYTVYVKDINGCGQDIEEVILLNYPRFFTPNGDGIHDTWYIKYAAYEPHFNVRIMDRYGKVITTFGSTSKGWDGTLNGIQLPSTDYWFVVTREDGRELKGHFSMVR